MWVTRTHKMFPLPKTAQRGQRSLFFKYQAKVGNKLQELIKMALMQSTRSISRQSKVSRVYYLLTSDRLEVKIRP